MGFTQQCFNRSLSDDFGAANACSGSQAAVSDQMAHLLLSALEYLGGLFDRVSFELHVGSSQSNRPAVELGRRVGRLGRHIWQPVVVGAGHWLS